VFLTAGQKHKCHSASVPNTNEDPSAGMREGNQTPLPQRGPAPQANQNSLGWGQVMQLQAPKTRAPTGHHHRPKTLRAASLSLPAPSLLKSYPIGRSGRERTGEFQGVGGQAI
jgi:hypothetical protein